MQFIKNLKIKNKLIILIIVFSAGFILFGITSVLTINKTKVNGPMYKNIILGKDIIADILPPPEYIIESYLTALQISEASQFNTADSSSQITELINYEKSLKETYELRHTYWNTALEEGEIKNLLVEDSYQYAQEFYAILDTKFIPAITAHHTADRDKYAQELKSAYAHHREVIDKLVVLTNQYNAHIEKSANTMILFSLVQLILIVILLICIIGILFYKISLSITKPILYISDTMRKIAYGDLSVTVDETYVTNDEIGDLCKAAKGTTTLLNNYLNYINEITLVLNTISEGDLDFVLTNDYHGEFKSIKDAIINISSSLSTILSHINQSAGEVTLHSKIIAEGAAVMANGASEQAAALEEILVSVTEIALFAKNGSQDAADALTVSHAFVTEVQNGDEKMLKLLDAIKEISDASKEVQTVMDTINNIAYKTNILAFNASIESARSGEYGAGFGIIADEIRKLSLQTTSAVSAIKQLITNSITAADNGTYLAKDTAQSLKNIVSGTSHSTLLVDKIAKDCIVQSVTIQEISQALEQISRVVQESAAISQESSSVSDTLHDQAEKLKLLIKKFNLRSA